MNDGEITYRRGDMYWVLNDNFGVDSKSGRPIIIMNNDNESAQYVVGLFTTTRERFGSMSVEINSPRKRSWVECASPCTVAKNRLGNYMYTLTEYEMEAVEKGVRRAFCLDSTPQEDEEKKELVKEIAILKAQLKEHENNKFSDAVERDMWKRMYERALEEAVSARVARDLANPPVKGVVAEVIPEVIPEVVAEVIPEEVVELPEINTCTGAELRKAGFQPGQIKHLIDHRPYKKVEDLRFIPMMNKVSYAILKHKVRCVPVEEKPKPKVVEAPVIEAPVIEAKPERVNVNTATIKDLMEIVGLSKTTATQIHSYRKKHGKYVSVEDLLNVPRFGKTCLKKYGPKLEV